MTLTELAPRLAHPQVRALAWLIGSPGLLDASDPRYTGRLVSDAWCAEALMQAAPWLLALDRDPAALDDYLAQRPTRRLGHHAESLLAFWSRARPGIELLAQNLAVRDASRTLGEFDFVFRAPGADRGIHWETAIKFYLWRPDSDGLAAYVGPAKRDDLATKVARVFGHQLELGATPEGNAALRQLGLSDVRACAWIKGWLFYPHGQTVLPATGVNMHHPRGWWLRAAPGWEEALAPERRYCVLPRLDWISWPWCAAQNEVLDRMKLAASVAAQLAAGEDALMVVELAQQAGDWREQQRGFVVPADW